MKPLHPMPAAFRPGQSLASPALISLAPISIALTVNVSGCTNSFPQIAPPKPSVTAAPATPAATSPAQQAQAYIGAMNRTQQAIFLETSAFSTALDELKINPPTGIYTYSIRQPPNATTAIFNLATTREPNNPNFLGIVAIITDTNNERTTTSQICQTDQPIGPDLALPSIALPSIPAQSEAIPCPPGFQAVP